MRSLTQMGLVFLFVASLSSIGFAQPGVIRTVAGNGTAGFSGDGGPATSAKLNSPWGLAIDSAGNLYVADGGNNRIREITPAGIIATIAGNGTAGFSGDGGPATSAQLFRPDGVAVDTAGNLYIADTANARVRKVTTSGVISTVAGNGIASSYGDGGPATSAAVYPNSLVLDAAGNLYIGQSYCAVRKITTSTGIISTVAGNGTFGFSGDGGPATSAQIATPWNIALDLAGNLYIADAYNFRVRKVTTSGVISTVAGNGSTSSGGDGGPATSAGMEPYDVAFDAGGDLYIADYNRIRQVENMGSIATFFPQIAVGGGYTTILTVTNTGSTTASASLILTNQQGNPLTVNGTLTDSSGTTQPALPGYSFPLTVPAGGTIFLSATGMTTSSPVTVGWGQLSSTGGSLSAVATYEYTVGSMLQTMVGVLQSQALQYATLPVDNNTSQSKQTLYAIANPSSQTAAIKLALVGQDGTVVDDTVTVTLLPGQQIARYLWQDVARPNFIGSLVVRGQNGATFIAVALVEKQGVMAVIPLISGKAPGVPN
jgi:hypothetical protein